MRKIYLFMVLALVCLPLASAGTETNIWFTGGTTGNQNIALGALVVPNFDQNTLIIGLFDSVDSADSKCFLFNVTSGLGSGAGKMIENVSITSTGNNRSCTFTAATRMNKGDRYLILYGALTALRVNWGQNVVPSALYGTNLNITNTSSYYYDGATLGFYSNQYWGIRSITSTTISQPLSNITFIGQTPNNNTIINTGAVNITTNASIVSNYGNSTIYLYDSSWSLVASNASTSNVTVLQVVGLGAGRFYFNATAFNSSGSVVAGTETRTFYNDLTFPTITLNGNNEFNQSNITTQNAFDKQVRLNMTFTDDNKLYGFEVNITKAGVVYYNETNQTLNVSVITQFNYTRLLNAAYWPNGVYDVTVLVSDSHTAKEIKSYEPELLDSKLKFKVHNGNVIEISSLDESVVDTVKSLDRYDFQFDFKDKKVKDRMFKVTSTKYPIQYIEGSPYKGHFVVYGEQGGNWVDFEGIDGLPQVQKVNDFEYRVYFSNVPAKPVFKSIGGLNVYSANYSFYVGNYSFNNPQALAGEERTLWINLTKDVSLTDFSAFLVYNGVSYQASETDDSAWVYFENVSLSPNITSLNNFTWNVTVNVTGGGSYNFNVSSTQQVYSFGIDNCSTGANTTLNVSYWIENLPTVVLTNSMEVELSAWATDPSNSFDYSATFSPATSHRICIFPGNAELYADVYFKYTSATGFVHRYYLLNHSFNVTPQSLQLYNWNDTTSTSILKLTTRKLTDYTYYKNIVVALQRKYVGEGVYRNVQMDESGDFGLINFNILERTTDYRLSFVERETGRNLKVTQDLKFVCVSGVCDLTYLLNPNATSAVDDEISFIRSYDNNTRMYVLNWSDDSGTTQTVRLFVWKNTVTGLASVCDTTQVANSGSISCNTTGYQGQAYVSLRQNGELVWGEYLDLAKVSLGSVIGEAEGGFWSLGIMVIAVAFGLFSPVAAIVAGVVGLVMIFMLGTLTVLTTTGIIIAAIVGAVLGLRLRQ